MKSLVFMFFYISLVLSATIEKNESRQIKKNIGGRIINGMPAEDTEFPYMAALWTTTSLGRYFCGGAAIDRQWILTAGHCVLNATAISVQMGSVSLSGTSSNRVTMTATSFVLHPDFNPETLVSNIGLVYLPEALRYNDYVNVIALPTAALADETLLTTVGWGQIDDEHSGPVDVLQKVSVISFMNEHCKNIYGNQITDTMVCAMGSYNEGTCIGDIGGPLVQSIDGEDVVVGVASFLSFNGCESLDPSGFERAFSYIDWIKNATNIA